MTCRVRFDKFEFDPGSGELVRHDDGGASQIRRLAPQPARLLALLIEKDGELLGREEIQRLLWPDVQVDFDQGLHFCIRQVRAALEDSAADPRFIETLPRRGYRFLLPVRPVELEVGPSAAMVGRQTKRNRPRIRMVVGVVVVVLVLIGLQRTLGFLGPLGADPLRIAIMTFQAPEGWPAVETSFIAESLLDSFGRAKGVPLEVIGPTTTAAYEDEPEEFLRLIDDFRIDYVVNGRFLKDRGSPQILAELIRASDGAHVWVQRFGDLGSWEPIARGIAERVAIELGFELMD